MPFLLPACSGNEYPSKPGADIGQFCLNHRVVHGIAVPFDRQAKLFEQSVPVLAHRVWHNMILGAVRQKHRNARIYWIKFRGDALRQRVARK